MQVSIQLFGDLRDYLPDKQRGRASLEVASGAVVQDVLDTLGIDHPVVVAVNEEHDIDHTAPLQPGDKVMVFGLSAGG
jgi:sulfur carrier protein ThiS